MRARIRQGTVLFVSFIVVLFATAAFGAGADSDMPNLQILQAQIDHQRDLAKAWECKANVEFSLGMLIVVLGAAVTMLQKFDRKKWCSYVVAGCGLLISTLTFGTKEYFDVDHKTYRRNAAIANVEINNAETYLAIIISPETAPEDKQMLLAEVVNSIAKLKSLSDTISQAGAEIAGSGDIFSLTGTAYAKTPLPEWVTKQASETSTSFRFVGTAQASSIARAQALAQTNASNAAEKAMSVSSETVNQYAVSVNKHVEFDSGAKKFTVYIMLELNKAFMKH